MFNKTNDGITCGRINKSGMKSQILCIKCKKAGNYLNECDSEEIFKTSTKNGSRI